VAITYIHASDKCSRDLAAFLSMCSACFDYNPSKDHRRGKAARDRRGLHWHWAG